MLLSPIGAKSARDFESMIVVRRLCYWLAIYKLPLPEYQKTTDAILDCPGGTVQGTAALVGDEHPEIAAATVCRCLVPNLPLWLPGSIGEPTGCL